MRATHALHNARAYQKKQADKHRRPLTLNEGDVVMLSTRNLTLPQVRAFRKRYMGPLKVTQKLLDIAYWPELPHDLHIHDVFHVSLLKPYHVCSERFEARRQSEGDENIEDMHMIQEIELP